MDNNFPYHEEYLSESRRAQSLPVGTKFIGDDGEEHIVGPDTVAWKITVIEGPRKQRRVETFTLFVTEFSGSYAEFLDKNLKKEYPDGVPAHVTEKIRDMQEHARHQYGVSGPSHRMCVFRNEDKEIVFGSGLSFPDMSSAEARATGYDLCKAFSLLVVNDSLPLDTDKNRHKLRDWFVAMAHMGEYMAKGVSIACTMEQRVGALETRTDN